MTSTERTLRLAAITALLFAGVMAGAQFGKFAPLVELYQAKGYSLAVIGWLASAIGIFVALAAIPAGIAIEARGTRRAFLVASVVLVLGGVGLAVFDGPYTMLAMRLVEALGYLVLVIATPAIMASVAPPAWRGPALALWGGFVPVGFAAADYLSAIVPFWGPQVYLVAVALCYALLAALSAVLLASVPDFDAPAAIPAAARDGLSVLRATANADVVLVALAFGAFVIVTVGFFSFMPAFVAGPGSGLALSAGTIALMGPLGNVVASVIVRGAGVRLVAVMAAAGFALMALAAVPVFSGAGGALSTAGAVGVAMIGGIVASALFAAVPLIVRPGGSAAIAIGMIAQTGGISTVIGPPLAGLVIDSYGWPAFGWFLAATSCAGFVILLPLLARRSATSR